MQMARDWYREVTSEVGMHEDLVNHWVRASALLITPIAPHFAEHVWTTILEEPKSVQLALWPEPPKPVDRAIIQAGQYMRGTIKTIRDAELSMLKKMSKSKNTPFDPKKPKSVRIYVATTFPEWQDRCVKIVEAAYDFEKEKVDDKKVRDLLTKEGLIKDKRAMPFAQLFKVRSTNDPRQCASNHFLHQKRIAEFGAKAAFQRSLPFPEEKVLNELLPYLKKSLNLVDVDVWMVDDALTKSEPGFTKTIIEGAEPGSPAFEYRNV